MYRTIEEFKQEWEQEAELTQRVLDALTDASLAQPVWQEGRTLGRLAWHVTTSVPAYLSRFGVTLDPVPNADHVPSSAKHIADAFRTVRAKVVTGIQQQWADETLAQVQPFFGRELLPNAAILAMLIKHMIHHRGQMTVLTRQAGLAVPGVYGPAKEEWSRLQQSPPAI